MSPAFVRCLYDFLPQKALQVQYINGSGPMKTTATPTALDEPTAHYTRERPSARYRALTRMYRQLHDNGDGAKGIAPEQMFSGLSMPANAEPIRKLIVEHGARTILDYGAGKGMQYGPLLIKLADGREFTRIQDFWGVEHITCYDPGFVPSSTLPTGMFDGVICTDVMEHCPEEDLPWILGEIFAFARLFVYGNIASYPALKTMPNGENAHCTVRPPEWWKSLLQVVSAGQPRVRYRFDVDLLASDSDGKTQVRTVKLQG
jgi:hypothetical protein